jgi:hypothetical protein
MESMIKGLTANQKLAYRDDIPLNNYAPYTSGLTQSFDRINKDINSRMASRMGPRDINTLTDREYDRLIGLLNRLAAN